LGGPEPGAWRARQHEPITGVWGRNLVRRSGASPPEVKSSLAFESPVAEQNVPDSGYVAVHTGVNHKAFSNQKFKLTCMGVHSNYNELRPSCLGGGLISMVGRA